ncbi:non-ribosomal peptide synthetase [Hyphomonas oceanitis]|uniref:Amino acid adenylation enzyme/thioester reductase family protein n=1 Tax=Hyphomonas oceanitis SCH89 TaxID=1280953 RepID=A0A059G3S1_9PROT|nr:non-ribosomal peptide synthetase [Hyphomonas oceanitis]KDA01436.1 amino acid adenylation enzyme/thioester reductase family protein [Hyphomonas oceanitis SCH89]
MDVGSFIEGLSNIGVALWVVDGAIRFRGPKGALSEIDKITIRENHSAIVEFLTNQDVIRDLPLTDGQRSLWFVHRQAPLSPTYNLGTAMRVRAPIDAGLLEVAFQKLVDRHSALRASFPVVANNPVQRIPPRQKVHLECYRLQGPGEADALAHVQSVHKRPFNLATGPVCRLALVCLAPQDHIILFGAHHIVCDATGAATACHDLKQFYIEAAAGETAELSRQAADFPDFVDWQRASLSGPRGKALLAHWQERLKPPLPTLALPTNRPRPFNRQFRGDTLQRVLSSAQIASLDAMATRARATRSAVLIALMAVLLGRISEQDDIIIGTPFYGRENDRFETTVGHFANPLPIRLTVSQECSFNDLMMEARERLLDALDNQDMPLLRIVDALNPPRDATRMPFFDVLFTFLSFDHVNAGMQTSSDAKTRAIFPDELYLFSQMEGQFDLSLRFEEIDGGLTGSWSFDTDLFDRSTIEEFASIFEELIAEFSRDSSISVRTKKAARPLQGLVREQGKSDMDVHELFGRLAERGVALSLDGDQLRINAPKGAIDNSLREELIAIKPAVMEMLKSDAAATRAGMGKKTNLPLSYAQQRLWFLNRLDPTSTAFNVAAGAWMYGALEPALIHEAFKLLAKRHDALRMRFVERDGNPVAESVDDLMPYFEYLEVEHVAPERRKQEVERIMGERLRQPFDLATGPLFGYTLVRLSEGEYASLLLAHHIIVDGWSMAVMHRELVEIYDALTERREARLPEVKAQATEHARRERRMAVSPEWASHIDFWRTELKDAPAVIELPNDHRRPANQTFNGGHFTQRFDVKLLADLSALARSEGVTLYMLLMAGWAATLYRYSGQSDIVLGSPNANRNNDGQEGMVGCLINNIVVRCRINGDLSFSQYLANVRSTVLDSLEHGELPFDLLVDTINPERSPSHAPIFQALFSLMTFPKIEHGFKGTEVDPMMSGTGYSRYDLSLDCVEFGGELITQYEFATDLFDVETIARLHRHYEALLRGAISDPSTPVKALQMLTADDVAIIATSNERTAKDFDRRATALDMIEACVREVPNLRAVTDSHTTLTYAELDIRANRLAHLLRENGVRRGSLVAVSLERNVNLPMALLAVWKAGASYLPLDPKHPQERIQGIVGDADVDLILTEEAAAGQFADDHVVLVLDKLASSLELMPVSAPDRETAPEDLAYVIYTSGSTGRPKGVEVEHRNLAAFLVAMKDTPGIREAQTLLSVTTPSFDIFGLEAWLPLASKARIVVASREVALDGRALADLMESEGVDILQATPATWNVLIETGWRGRKGLKALCGGEALPLALAESLLERGCDLWNMYGPTETTIWSSVQHIENADDALSIGKPIANTRTYILDDQGAPVPPGAVGELCIGGEGVSRGYRGRQDLTDERFQVLDLPGREKERVYRTGDYVRETVDGRLVYLGRRDFQVKIRGFRIELGEIESEIGALENVAECAVVAHERVKGDLELVAYVVPAAGKTVEPGSLRALLRAKLPNYMVPAHVVVLGALPLTPNLKVDRKALPAPQIEQAPSAAVGNLVMSPTERGVAEIWCDVLGRTQVGLDDNFFDIGGHSMLLVRLHERLRNELGATIALIELFQRTTVAQQAAAIPGGTKWESARDNSALPAALPNQSDRLARAKKRAERFRDGQ